MSLNKPVVSSLYQGDLIGVHWGARSSAPGSAKQRSRHPRWGAAARLLDPGRQGDLYDQGALIRARGRLHSATLIRVRWGA